MEFESEQRLCIKSVILNYRNRWGNWRISHTRKRRGRPHTNQIVMAINTICNLEKSIFDPWIWSSIRSYCACKSSKQTWLAFNSITTCRMASNLSWGCVEGLEVPATGATSDVESISCICNRKRRWSWSEGGVRLVVDRETQLVMRISKQVEGLEAQKTGDPTALNTNWWYLQSANRIWIQNSMTKLVPWLLKRQWKAREEIDNNLEQLTIIIRK